MRCRTTVLVILASLAATTSLAHEEMDLPPGPIKDRHELMEGIGANAKKIGDALKVKDLKAIAPAAAAIAAAAKKIPALFPAGSTSPDSRAKPEIWADFPKFEKSANDLATAALALEAAAQSGGDAGSAAKKMFGHCKGCHDSFRVPEE